MIAGRIISDDDSRMADLGALALLASLIVWQAPGLAYLSRACGLASDFSPDPLGSAANACGVALLGAYALAASRRASRAAAGLKTLIVVLAAVLYAALPAASDMAARARVGIQQDGRFVAYPHDGGVLQTEAAMDFLLDGVNPYAAYYGRTAMAQSHHSQPGLWRAAGFEENPAFRFFPYPPGVLALSLPAYVLWKGLFGGYDQRVAYLLALAWLAWLAHRLPRRAAWRPAFTAFAVLNPAAVYFTVQGYNDVLAVALIAAAASAAGRGGERRAGVAVALACGVKQLAWPLAPLYLAWLWGRHAAGGPRRAAAAVLRAAWPAAAAGLALFAPFLAWDAPALFRSLVTGQTAIYPFRPHGIGCTALLMLAGAIDAPRSAFPMGLLGAAAALPATAWGMLKLARRPSAAGLLAWYAAVLGILLFFSRYFARNYLWIPLAALAVAWALEGDEAASE